MTEPDVPGLFKEISEYIEDAYKWQRWSTGRKEKARAALREIARAWPNRPATDGQHARPIGAGIRWSQKERLAILAALEEKR